LNLDIIKDSHLKTSDGKPEAAGLNAKCSLCNTATAHFGILNTQLIIESCIHLNKQILPQ
jgi:hypothetical protein